MAIMRRAYFVVGAEGSGTYMLWNALQEAGCHAEGWHNGEHADYKFDEMPDILTFRRSLPHNGVWPPLGHINYQLEQAGYDVTMLAIIREPNATDLSVVRRVGGVTFEEASRNQRKALQKIYHIHNMPKSKEIIAITYEAFCLSAAFRRWLFIIRLGLTNPVDFEIKFANEKYYE